MKKATNKNITMKQINEVNKEMGYEKDSRYLTDAGYAFYWNQLFINGLDVCDADRYANLNTILGYDVGIRKFRSLDDWLWTHAFDLMELNGSDEDKQLLQEATEKTHTKELDYSKWNNLQSTQYEYKYFES